MSVYTLLNQKQIEELLANYGIASLEYVVEIADGIENSNYLVRAEAQDFVLTIFEQKKTEELRPFFRFMAAACAQGFALPAPLLNQHGEALSFFDLESDTKHFILCKRLPGTHPDFTTTQLCEQLGKDFGELHALSKDADFLEEFTPSDLSYVIPKAEFSDFLSEEKLATLKEEIAFIKTITPKLSSMPQGICHCDFFPDNALIENIYGDFKVTGFLDWYDARYTALIYDLAIISISWCSDGKGTLDPLKEQALLKGYAQTRRFDAQEHEVWLAMQRIAAFSFWLSRELYHHQMKSTGRPEQVNSKKQPEEFWLLLNNLKQNY